MKLHEVLQSYIKELEKVLQADAQLIKFDVALLDVTWCSKRFEISLTPLISKLLQIRADM